MIAPCTHNGTCPMSRHERNHAKRNPLFRNYNAVDESETTSDDEGSATKEEDDNTKEEDRNKEEGSFMSDWVGMDEEERNGLKLMLGVEDMDDEEFEEMIRTADAEGLGGTEEDDSDSDTDDDDTEEDDTDEDEDNFYNVDKQEANNSSSNRKETSSNMAGTHVFDTSFCSFVHTFPGDTGEKKGEKFSYLVLQKRLTADDKVTDNLCPRTSSTMTDSEKEKEETPSLLLEKVDVVDMMSKSVYHSQRLKEIEMQKRKEQNLWNSLNNNIQNRKTAKDTNVMVQKAYDTHHQDQTHQVLQRAVQAEDAFLDSTDDSLGLEMLTGDKRRQGWGRLIRAPLKRKGHVLLDYCSAGNGGAASSNVDAALPDGSQGRIPRHKVSRGWSARAAPGCYAAARKARWGGLWPDLSERIKLAEHEDFVRKKSATKKAAN